MSHRVTFEQPRAYEDERGDFEAHAKEVSSRFMRSATMETAINAKAYGEDEPDVPRGPHARHHVEQMRHLAAGLDEDRPDKDALARIAKHCEHAASFTDLD